MGLPYFCGFFLFFSIDDGASLRVQLIMLYIQIPIAAGQTNLPSQSFSHPFFYLLQHIPPLDGKSY